MSFTGKALKADPPDGSEPIYASPPIYLDEAWGDTVREHPFGEDHASAGETTEPWTPEPQEPPPEPGEYALQAQAKSDDGLTCELQVTGGKGKSEVNWGDESEHEQTDLNGHAEHTYAEADTYTVSATDGEDGHHASTEFEAKAGGSQPSVPTLTNLSPSSGAQMATTDVTLTGTGFTSPGAKPQTSADGTAWDDASFESSPAVTDTTGKVKLDTSTSGVLKVRVNASAGASSSKDFTVTAPAQAPTLSAISPASAEEA